MSKVGWFEARKYRAFDPRLAKRELTRAGEPPFSWVEGYVPAEGGGPVSTRLRMAIAGGRVVTLEGVDGLRALLEQGDGRPFDELVDAIAPIVGFEILRLGEHVQRLCDPKAGWVDPASQILIDRYRPPKLTATSYVFYALARRPDRDDLVRVEIDRATLAVTSETFGKGPLRQSERRGGNPPPGMHLP